MSVPRLLPGLVAALCACHAPNPTVPHRAGPPRAQESTPAVAEPGPAVPGPEVAVEPPIPEPPPFPAVAVVGDERIGVDELVSLWMRNYPRVARDVLQQVILDRVIEREAERLSIEVSEELLKESTLRRLADLEQEIQRDNPGVSLDEWIAGNRVLDPLRYRESLREEVRHFLLESLEIRQFILSQEWAEARVIVTEKREEADAALETVRGGAPFARVAAEKSIDPTGAKGGRVPPLLRNASLLSRLAFGTAAGELGGPVQEGGRWLIIQVDEIHAPLAGSWGEISAAIEASLQERPVDGLEYDAWMQEMHRRYRIDPSPFFELVGEPPPAGR